MKTGLIIINNNIFETLLAISESEQINGLMNVKPPTPIMSFVYDSPKINKFWMNNTPAPLDIIFCNKGKITQICQGVPYSTELIGDNKFSDLVIEFPKGTLKNSDISLGDSVILKHY